MPDGRLLSPHDPGLSVLTLPAYHFGGLAAVLGAVVVGMGAPGVVYASQVYQGPAALCVAVALLVDTGDRPRPLVLAAALLALACLGVKDVVPPKVSPTSAPSAGPRSCSRWRG